MSEIVIRKVRVAELPQFIAEYQATAPPNAILPITPQRAESQAHNPAAQPDDVALMLAYLGDRLVGYLGLLPVFLRDGERLSRVFWFSTWLAAPEVRGRGIGRRLKQAALDLGIDAVSTGNIHTRKANRKLGCMEREPLIFYRLDLTGAAFNPIYWTGRAARKALHMLGRDFTAKNGSANAKINEGLRPAIAARLRSLAQKWLFGLEIAETPRVPEYPPPDARPLPQTAFHRPPRVVNWMLEYPWVLPRSVAPSLNYYFTAARDEFLFRAFTLHDGKHYLGFAVFSFSADKGTRWVKTLDYRLSKRARLRAVSALAIKLAAEWRAHWLEMPAELAKPLQEVAWVRALFQPRERLYQAWTAAPDSPLAQAWENLKLDYCDGDTPFT